MSREQNLNIEQEKIQLLMEEDYFQIDVNPSLSYLIEEELLSKGVNFEQRDRVTGFI